MAEKRKLLAEMDKVFRKVDEGVELFEEIMQKMTEASSDNQREKFQEDLKKEIKKLQRLRDQIKGWQNSNEIKDKDKLTSFRKKIEFKMEEFKEIERENKTKPHSKQGLCAEEKMDPKEKERADTIEWLQNCISRLNEQCDSFESNIENLSGSTGKKGKKLDKDKIRQSDEFRRLLERHKFHVSKLELIMRLVNNDTLDSTEVYSIRDEVEDYMERNTEDDYVENEMIYDDLNLNETEITQQLGNVTNIGTLEEADDVLHSDTNSMHSNSPDPDIPHSMSAPKEHSLEPLGSVYDIGDSKMRHSSGGEMDYRKSMLVSTRSTPNTPIKLTSHGSQDSALWTPSPCAATPPPLPVSSLAAQTMAAPQTVAYSVAASVRSSSSASVTKVTSMGSREEYKQIAQQPQRSASVADNPVQNQPDALSIAVGAMDRMRLSPLPHRHAPSPPTHAHTAPVMNGSNSEGEGMVPALKSIAEQAASAQTTMAQGGVSSYSMQGYNNILAALGNQHTAPTQQHQARIPAHLGASPLGPWSSSAEYGVQQGLMDSGVRTLPLPMDSERLRHIYSKQPCHCPNYYPQHPPPMAETLEYFNRLQPETLFFIFYYNEGTKAQYLAAKALKKQSWRFHKKYLMWFQRHEEPKTITDDYEQGTYVYFDFEKWAQRKKEGFTFEYRYLEDRELS